MRNLEKRQEFIRLRGMGESFDSIAKKIGISKQTLIKWSKLFSREVTEATLKVLDSVIKEYDLAKSGRLKIIAKELLRLDAELSKRDLASIPTSKLIQIKMKALDAAGDILYAKRVEHGEKINWNDGASRYEEILKQCGFVEGPEYETKKLKGNDDGKA